MTRRAEGEPAEDEGEQPGHEQHHQAGEPEHVEALPEPRQPLVAQEHHEVGQLGVGVDAARPDLAHHVHPHRVAAEREEGAVAEREDAGVAPDEVERHREQRVGQVLAEQRDDVARHVPGLARRDDEVADRHQHHDDEEDARGRCRCAGRSGRRLISGLHRAAALREEAARPLLDEQDDEDEDQRSCRAPRRRRARGTCWRSRARRPRRRCPRGSPPRRTPRRGTSR